MEPSAPPPDAATDFLMKAPELSMPKGGGAIRGLGEKFAANPVTGSATFSIPLPVSPGRAGFAPQLSLRYDSAAGNGPFGFGWTLSLPAITRKTDKGLPRYHDDDVFLLAGAEDLVPVLDSAGHIADDATSVAGYVIRRYRPRIEGLFARIERWTRDDGDTHWRTIASDNVLTIYGHDENHRIADPADRTRVFSWLVSEVRDDRGNAIVYDFTAEDGVDLDLTPTSARVAPPIVRRARPIATSIAFATATRRRCSIPRSDARASRVRPRSMRRAGCSSWPSTMERRLPAHPTRWDRGRAGSIRSRRIAPGSRSGRIACAAAY